MGEEVAQFKGSYKVSEGLLEKFGSAESLIPPLAKLPFQISCRCINDGYETCRRVYAWSFCYVAFDQIFNNAANVRYMSEGL